MISTLIGNKPRDELLHFISEKERELEQIRLIAEKSSEEENRNLHQQLHELQFDLDQNAKLLLEKERTIGNLQKQDLALRDEHAREITNLEHELRKQFEEEINKTRDNCEDETSVLFQRYKDEVRSSLEKEYNSKLLLMERDMESKFDCTLDRKLNEKEEDLRNEFRRILNKKEIQEEDFKKRIEKEKISIIHNCESEWKDRESMLLKELSRNHEINYQGKIDDFLNRMKLERQKYKANMEDLVEERNCLLKERDHVEDMLTEVQCENKELNERIQESISVILELEKEYDTNVIAFDEEIRNRKKEIKNQCDLIETLKIEIPNINRRHEKEKASMREKHSDERICLRNELQIVQEKLEEYESFSKVLHKKAQKEVRRLKDYMVTSEDRLASKNSEIKRLKDKVHGYESSLCSTEKNHAEAMIQINSNKKAYEALMKKSEDGFEIERCRLREELRKRSTEFEMLKIERESSANKTTEMENKLSEASKALLNRQKEYLEKENALHAMLDESRNETLDLRKSVTLMRNEMELMAGQNKNSEPSTEDKEEQHLRGNQKCLSMGDNLVQEVNNSLSGFKESVESLKKDLKR